MMTNEERNLVHQAQQGDHRAFETLVQRYDQRVIALAYQLVGNRHDAEDIYQEVFMRVFHNITKFRFQSDFYTWLYRIVVNTAISYRKKRTRHSHQSIDAASESEHWHWTPEADTPDPDAQVMNAELKGKIDDTLDNLSLMQRTVFVLRFFQDFKIKDIASIIGCTEGTVKNYLFRGTRKMRKSLAAYVNQ